MEKMEFTKKQIEGMATITLSDDTENPTTVVNWGHVDAETLNKNFQEEGWNGVGNYSGEEIRHLYGKVNDDQTQISWVETPTEGYKPITVVPWD